MFREGKLDLILRTIKRFIPKRAFVLGAKIYHPALAWTGALRYGFPSRQLKVIGITGTKGKSTTVYLTALLLEAAGQPTAAIGSLGYKIKDKTWPNNLKMTMPGRWKIQRFLREALRAGCSQVVMETPSEGLMQGRHLGVHFDCAVFLNLHPEHLEAHGSYANYRAAKRKLFEVTSNIHVLNADDSESAYFAETPCQRKIFFGIQSGDLRASNIQSDAEESRFTVYGTDFKLNLGGLFNIYNALAALAIAAMYGLDLPTAKPVLEKVSEIPGRLQWLQKKPFGLIVDYAHTPESLTEVYKTVKPKTGRLLCILGAAGGGRDKWKRPIFGQIAEKYGDLIYLTNEDPYDEKPEQILADILEGISQSGRAKVKLILDRKEAIAAAIKEAKPGDLVIITGKGSENSLALAGGRKMPWSDSQTAKDLLWTLSQS